MAGLTATRATVGATRLLPLVLALALVLAFGATGCDGLLKNDELPPEVTDPAVTKTPQGALAAYNGTIAQFAEAYSLFVATTGLFSDELHSISVASSVDARSLSLTETNTLTPYNNLQRVRGQAGQAIGLLTDYRPVDTASYTALRGHVYALEGYAEVFLAELFCSGIPLSTLDYHGEYTLQPGSSTEAVFIHAAALFDSALALAGDSTAVLHLAQVGKARALLALGRYAEAAAAVGAAPDGYTDILSYTARPAGPSSSVFSNFADSTDPSVNVADVEGLNGLDYRASGDLRTRVRRVQRRADNSDSLWFPTKYATNGSSPLVLASGVEARLIEAEAALQAKDYATWLAKLNYLRQTAWSTIQDCSSGMCQPGATGPLADTTDPGTDSARVSLLFRERAFWLFLTGHRQGDLRRLVRPVGRGGYGRAQNQVYPIGPTGFTRSQYLFYGSDVTAPIPEQERVLNPLFTGCISPDA